MSKFFNGGQRIVCVLALVFVLPTLGESINHNNSQGLWYDSDQQVVLPLAPESAIPYLFLVIPLAPAAIYLALADTRNPRRKRDEVSA